MRRNNKRTDDSELLNFLEGIEEECQCQESKHEMDEESGDNPVMELATRFKIDTNKVDADLVEFMNGQLEELGLVEKNKYGGEGYVFPNEIKNTILSALKGDEKALSDKVGSGPSSMDRVRNKPRDHKEQMQFIRAVLNYMRGGNVEEECGDMEEAYMGPKKNPIDKESDDYKRMRELMGMEPREMSGQDKSELAKLRRKIGGSLREEGGKKKRDLSRFVEPLKEEDEDMNMSEYVQKWVDGKKEEVVKYLAKMTMTQGFQLADSIAEKMSVDSKEITNEFMSLAEKLKL